MIDLVTIGSDPEVILVDQKNQPVGSLGIIPGKKARPTEVHRDKYGVYQVLKDNALAEYTVPPVKTAEAFADVIFQGLDIIEEIAAAQGFSVCTDSTAIYDEKYLKHPSCREFGCEEDYSCWTGIPNQAPQVPLDGFRSAGGHIHLGLSTVESFLNREIVKVLDLYLGIPGLLVDSDKSRRRLYGKAGSYRNKQYGLEYRALSNFWIFDKDLIKQVYRNCEEAVKFCAKGNLPDDLKDVIPNVINNYDVGLAEQICQDFSIPTFEVGVEQFTKTKIELV